MKCTWLRLAGLIIAFGVSLNAQPNGSSDHTGVLVWQRTFVNSKPDDLYHVGGYVCTKGDEHYGPECTPEVSTPDHHDSATLKLEDGRVLLITGTTLAGVASLEAMSRNKDTGTWNVVYRLTSIRENPITHHLIQSVEVIFPMTIAGEPHPVTKRIAFDTSDSTLGAFTAPD
jgi:hypothetical protein